MGEPQSIAIFSAQFLPHMGGVEVFTHELASRLAQRGCSVVVVASEEPGCSSHENVDVGGSSYEVVRLPSVGLLHGRFPVPRLCAERRKAIQELESRSFDGVLVNTRFYPHSVTGVRFANRKGIPVAILDHGSDYVSFGSPLVDPIVRLYERGITSRLKRSANAFYGISQESCRWLSRLGVEPSGIIPNAIDASAFRDASSGRSFRKELAIKGDELLVAYAGRLVPEKGVREIAAAAEILRDRGIPVRFVLAGEGPLGEELQQAHGGAISMVGRLDAPDVAALLNETDVFVFPSRSEGFGSALLEAAVSGAALISTPVGIAGTLIPDREYGVILNEADEISIADAVGALAGNLAATKAMGARAQQRAEQLFSWGATIESLMSALGLES